MGFCLEIAGYPLEDDFFDEDIELSRTYPVDFVCISLQVKSSDVNRCHAISTHKCDVHKPEPSWLKNLEVGVDQMLDIKSSPLCRAKSATWTFVN